MIALSIASSMSLTMLQASITAPTDSFRGCLREAVSKAKSEKVAGDAIETYLKMACTAQMGSLKDALISFRMKNGMTRKAAASDAEMTVDDYVGTPADNYRFLAQLRAPKAAQRPPAAPPPQRHGHAAAAKQPPKP